MTLKIPANLQKYVVLSDDDEIIDRFKCPVEGCSFTTRLGPGALRMHLLLKSDPNMTTRYDKAHEEYSKKVRMLDMDLVKELSKFPRKEVAT